jgi:hypothetical protein
MAAPLERLLAPDYLGDLEARPIEELRSMRAECQEVETGLSLVRRLVQGHLDIVGLERARRREGAPAGDRSSLLEQLPAVLAEHTQAPGLGRLPVQMAPTEIDPALEAELAELVGPGLALDPTGLDDAELSRLTDALVAFEAEVSGRRRALFERLDAVQAELARRYRSGDASVDALLT